MKKYNISTYLLSIIFCLLVVSIITNSGEAFSAAADGLKLWLNVVFPALLPFFICVEILIGLGLVSFFGSTFKPLMGPIFNVPGEGAFGFFMSISSGYPVGARITAKLRQEKLCTPVEGQRLLSLCSTSGPLFIIGAVATGIMNNPALGFFLAISHYMSAITIGLAMRFYGSERTMKKRINASNPIADMLDYRKKDGRSFGVLMRDAVKDGVNLILMIGGYIIFFSLVARMLKVSGILSFTSILLAKAIPSSAVTPEIISSFLIGFLEVTNGAKECAALQIPLIYKAVLVSFMIGFGGVSINAQVMSVIAETDLNFGIYFIVKLAQGAIASIYSFILLSWYPTLQVFNPFGNAGKNLWNAAATYSGIQAFVNSCIYMLIISAFMLAITILKNKKRLWIKSLLK